MLKFTLSTLLLFSVCFSEAQQMKIMSYNIRFDNPSDQPNHWEGRKEKLFALIKTHQPDLIGVQEALYHQLEDVVKALPHLAYVGVGRDDSKTKGEYSAILYDKNKYEVLRTETFWLSENPEEVASKNWDAAITRIVTWAEMKDKMSNKTFFWFNTHFDHVGKEARIQSAKLIRKQIENIAGKSPILLTGDFNCEPDDAPYQVIIEKGKVNLFDTSTGFKRDCTCCGFEVKKYEESCVRIDFIFRSKHFKVIDHITPTDNDGMYYPSDHLPVMATLKL
jgi:endonuclease/exonuclease/phosphatase family metal-dependent hydrolase